MRPLRRLARRVEELDLRRLVRAVARRLRLGVRHHLGKPRDRLVVVAAVVKGAADGAAAVNGVFNTASASGASVTADLCVPAADQGALQEAAAAEDAADEEGDHQGAHRVHGDPRPPGAAPLALGGVRQQRARPRRRLALRVARDEAHVRADDRRRLRRLSVAPPLRARRSAHGAPRAGTGVASST